MWMTDYFWEVKRQLRDVYGLTPSCEVGGEPCFDSVPDGVYRMEIGGKVDRVVFVGQKMHLLEERPPVMESREEYARPAGVVSMPRAVLDVVGEMERTAKKCTGPTGDCAEMLRDYAKRFRAILGECGKKQ